MAVVRAVEVEHKYAVPEGVALPSLARVHGAVRVREEPTASLEAVYLDTADRTLLRARIALRRRTGGHDAGWHVKLPAAGGRTELHAPIDPAAPDRLPAELDRALRSRLRGRALSPLAVVRTERRGSVVEGADGAAVEVVDDAVRALDARAGVQRSWREWEAEQVGGAPGDARLLEAVDRVLLRSGAVRSPSPAKLAQALGGAAPVEPLRPTTAGELLVDLLRAPAEQLHAGLLGLALEGDPDGSVVHGLRRTIRRLRSLLALTTIAGPAGEEVRRRLRPLGAVLGHARDPRVAAETAAALLDRLPPETPGLPAARRALVTTPLLEASAATEDALAALLADEALDAYAELDALLRTGPDGAEAAGRPKRVADRAARAVHRADRLGRRAGDDLDALHAARRAAKRARFSVEALVDAARVRRGSPLERAARRDEAAQDALGLHRDLALLLQRLPEVAAEVTARGEDAYALGAASELLRRDVRQALRRARRALRRLHR